MSGARTGGLVLLATAALLAVAASAGTSAPEPPGGTSVTVTVTGIRSAEGVVRACMSPDPDRFPRCQGDPHAFRKVVPAASEVRLVFSGVGAGKYAIALLHDENDNGKADRALGMMPREGFGFSRDAPVRMGPPSFADAAITIGDEPSRQLIHMRYMF